jgi:metallo-beta-lactamase class B/metallo-beta-lactamase class B GIM
MKLALLFLTGILATSPVARGEGANLQITQIDSGVYLHTSYRIMEGYGPVGSNGLVVVDGKQAVIVDTPWSVKDTEKLLSWMNKQGFLAKAGISTHSHEDRTAGIEALNSKSIPTFTSKMTNDILASEGKPTATNVFGESEISLLDGRLEIFYPGAGHTEDNLVVWLPIQRILFGGCLVRSLDWNSLGFTGDASIESWAESIRRIKSRYADIATVVPGHGSVGNPEILDHTIRLAEMAAEESVQSVSDAPVD